MPTVFNTAAKPWINPENAGTAQLVDELRAAVGRCPSGVLEIAEH